MVKRFFAAVLLLFASCALAEEASTRSYPLPAHGTLELTVPNSWREEVKPSPDGAPPTITFRPANGAAFRIMVTPVYPARAGAPLPDLARLKASVEKAAKEAAPHAAEPHIAIHDISGPGAAGYYFSATDKAPGPGPDDYRYMTQAELLAGGVITVMTALSNDDSGAVQAQALALIKSAQHRAPEQSIGVAKTQQGYELTVPASRLAMILPDPSLEQTEGAQFGGATSSRYFYFRKAAEGLSISGWFEPQDSFPGMRKFWKGETDAWRENGLPKPMHVVFKKIGKWDTITYDIDLPPEGAGAPKATDVHLRAHWLQAGTWIDLHLSLASTLPRAEAAARLEAILKTVQVREKTQ